jgi:hypothetical protein
MMNNQSESSYPSGKILRRMGYMRDQKGIFDRYLHEADFWKSHLEKTRTFIYSSVKKRKPAKLALLGSGWLLDIPLEELSDYCEEIHLYDIVHPGEIKYKKRNLKNVYFYEKDITGNLIMKFYNLTRTYKRRKKDISVDQIPVCQFTPDAQADLIISVNILNQLDILSMSYLEKYGILNEKEILLLRKKIQKAHVDMLKKHHGILITDYKEMLYDKDGRLKDERKLIHTQIEKGNIREEWIWYFDTQMTYNMNHKTYFKVLAAEF